MIFQWLQKHFLEFFARDFSVAIIFFILSAVCCLVLCGGISLLVRMLRNNKHTAVFSRKITYTLPDKENTFIRARLATALNDEAYRSDLPEPLSISFFHASALLDKTKEAPLSRAERLEMQTLAENLAHYRQKTVFDGRDVRAINELFLRILKLSAKYNV